MRGKCANMEMSNARKNSIPVRSEMHLTDASTGQKHSHWFCQYATAGIYIFSSTSICIKIHSDVE